MKSVILIFNVCKRPLAYFCILNQNVPKYVPNCVYLINFMFNNNVLQDYYGAPTRTRTADLLITNYLLYLSKAYADRCNICILINKNSIFSLI